VKTPTHPIHPMRPTRGHSCKYTSKSPLRLAGIRVNTQANRHSASLAFSHKHNLRLGAFLLKQQLKKANNFLFFHRFSFGKNSLYFGCL